MHIHFFRFLLIACLTLPLLGCAVPKQPPVSSIGSLKLGVAQFTQPKHPSEMLAGYMSEEAEPVTPELLQNLDNVFARTLSSKSSNRFAGTSQAEACSRKAVDTESGPTAAVHKWAAVGRCMGVDILIVPQVYEWRERKGSSMGVVKPAKAMLDFFVVNVKTDSLVSRSHFDETQSALSDNLLEAGKFFKRGGRWITGDELAQEAMERAIKELGL